MQQGSVFCRHSMHVYNMLFMSVFVYSVAVGEADNSWSIGSAIS